VRLPRFISKRTNAPGKHDLVLGRALTDHHPSHDMAIDPAMQRKHLWIIGATGTGKSRGVALPLALQRHRKVGGMILVDPHGEVARALLGYEVQDRRHTRDGFYRDLVYLRPSHDSVPPLNPLTAPYVAPVDRATGLRDAFVRSFPELEGAPTAETYLAPAALCLVENELPVPLLDQVLTSPELRAACLRRVRNPMAHAALSQLPDGSHAATSQATGSIRRRLVQVCLSDLVVHSLIHPSSVLNLREIMDVGRSVVLDLGDIQSAAVKSFYAASVLTSLERAAYTRDPERKPRHFMMLVDEFPSVAPKSPEQIAEMTAELRKFGVSLGMICQSTKQMKGDALGAAIENCGMIISLGLGADSARTIGRMIAKPDPTAVKYQGNDGARDTHYSRSEQQAALVDALRHLPPRHAVVGVRGREPVLVQLLDVPSPRPDRGALQEVRAEYRRRYQMSYEKARIEAVEHLRSLQLPIDFTQLWGGREQTARVADDDEPGDVVVGGTW